MVSIASRADRITAKSKQKELYSDFTTNFTLNSTTGSLVKVTNEESVKKSIKSLVLTQLGERFYHSDIGSTIFKSLFEPIDDITSQRMQTSILMTIKNYEPRAHNVRVEVTPVAQNNYYDVNVFFTIVNIPSEIFSAQIILNRIR